jgi:hypothetical protein
MKRRPGSFLLVLAVAAAPLAAAVTGGVEDAILALFRAARAGNDTVTMQAAASVAAFGPQAASGLVRSLGDRSPAELVWALRCLREIGSDVAKEPAFALCAHADAAVRAEAVWASATLGGTSSVTFLQRSASDPDDIVRRRAFDGLLEYGCQADGTMPIAAKGVIDKDFWVVLQAFQILDHQKKPERGVDPVLVELSKYVSRLDDRNADACFDFFVRRGGPDCGTIVEAALSSKQPCVVVAALKAAARLRHAPALRLATRLAGDADVKIAVAAIDCLSEINDPDSVVVLVDLLERVRDEERTDAIAVALRRMTSRLYGTDVALWRKYLAKQQQSR